METDSKRVSSAAASSHSSKWLRPTTEDRPRDLPAVARHAAQLERTLQPGKGPARGGLGRRGSSHGCRRCLPAPRRRSPGPLLGAPQPELPPLHAAAGRFTLGAAQALQPCRHRSDDRRIERRYGKARQASPARVARIRWSRSGSGLLSAAIRLIANSAQVQVDARPSTRRRDRAVPGIARGRPSLSNEGAWRPPGPFSRCCSPCHAIGLALPLGTGPLDWAFSEVWPTCCWPTWGRGRLGPRTLLNDPG